MKKQNPSIPYILLSLAILSFAFFVRTSQLESFPLHADEATGAHFVGQSLEGSYQYNPNHFHGPTLIYFAKLSAFFSQQDTWTQLNQQSLRNVNVCAGMFLILLILCSYPTLGKKATLISALFLSCSPFITYYNRIFIHESVLSLFLFLALAIVYHFFKKPTYLKAVLIGICLGMAASTKETFVITLFSWTVSYLLWSRDKLSFLKNNILKILTAFFVSFFTIALFYTAFFEHPKGFFDFFKAFWSYKTTAGHDKAFDYYIKLLFLPSSYGKLFWWEGSIFLLGILSYTFQKKKSKVASFFLLTGGIHFIVYSLLSYKVPWLVLIPWTCLILFAGVSIATWMNSLSVSEKTTSTIVLGSEGNNKNTNSNINLFNAKDIKLAIAIGLILIISLGHIQQCYRMLTRFHSDHRNPYAYVPSSKSIISWSQGLDELTNTKAFEGESYVIGNDYWPLPWYLKKIHAVHYTSEIPEKVDKAPLVIVMPAMKDKLLQHLANSHQPTFQGLRHEVSMIVFIRNDIWEELYQF